MSNEETTNNQENNVENQIAKNEVNRLVLNDQEKEWFVQAEDQFLKNQFDCRAKHLLNQKINNSINSSFTHFFKKSLLKVSAKFNLFFSATI
jgi:hypothetical protein